MPSRSIPGGGAQHASKPRRPEAASTSLSAGVSSDPWHLVRFNIRENCLGNVFDPARHLIIGWPALLIRSNGGDIAGHTADVVAQPFHVLPKMVRLGSQP